MNQLFIFILLMSIATGCFESSMEWEEISPEVTNKTQKTSKKVVDVPGIEHKKILQHVIGPPSIDANGNITYTLEKPPTNITIDGNKEGCRQQTEGLKIIISSCKYPAEVSISVDGSPQSEKLAPMIFVLNMNETNPNSGAETNSFTLPFVEGYSYNAYVDWGDGTTSSITSFNQDETTHTYAQPGEYTVKIFGQVEAWSMIMRHQLDDNTRYFNRLKLIKVKQLGKLSWKNLSYAFANTPISEFTVGITDTSNVTDMSFMFSGLSSLTSLTLSENFTTANVTDMSHMFSGLSSLTQLDVSSFNTSNVTNMSTMFQNMSSLTALDLSSFNTSNVNSMNGMFYNMSSLTSLNLSNFNTASVTTMREMFSGMSSLTSLTLSENFTTANVTDMSHMFSGLSSLTQLDKCSLA